MKKILLTIAGAVLAFDASGVPAQDARHRELAAGVAAMTAIDATRNLLTHHLGSFQDNDLDAVVSDYTDESVLITKDATYRGPREIRTFFAGLMPRFPRHKSSLDLDKMVVDNDVALIVWHARTPFVDVPFATDTFVVRAGKIHQQTFAGELKPLDLDRPGRAFPQ